MQSFNKSYTYKWMKLNHTQGCIRLHPLLLMKFIWCRKSNDDVEKGQPAVYSEQQSSDSGVIQDKGHTFEGRQHSLSQESQGLRCRPLQLSGEPLSNKTKYFVYLSQEVSQESLKSDQTDQRQTRKIKMKIQCPRQVCAGCTDIVTPWAPNRAKKIDNDKILKSSWRPTKACFKIWVRKMMIGQTSLCRTDRQTLWKS